MRHFLIIVALAWPVASPAAETPQQLFERRILPIFKSPNPSSCTECHLAGVDLKNYILPSHEQTFLSLRDQGMIDLKSPRDSKILRFISMQPEAKAGAALISEKMRRAELDAFTEWLVASTKDAKLVSASPLANPLAVEVRRADGSPFAGKPIVFEVVRNNGLLAVAGGAPPDKDRLP